MKSLALTLFDLMDNKTEYTISEIYKLAPDQKKTTIRGRIYDNLGRLFIRVSEGVYKIKFNDTEAILINGCGRSLNEIKNESIDLIYADHPWIDKSLLGTNRNFVSDYENSCFKYNQEDFDNKYRVLKKGGFLIENLPDENEYNFDYLYKIKLMAINAGFKYFAIVPWIKGNFVSCTGRKKKNCEQLMIFSKGSARKLRKDVQRNSLMSGTKEMLPTCFNHQPKSPKKRIHSAEKPIELFNELFPYFLNKGEWVLDQFAGSFNSVESCLLNGFNCYAYELSIEFFNKYITNPINNTTLEQI